MTTTPSENCRGYASPNAYGELTRGTSTSFHDVKLVTHRPARRPNRYAYALISLRRYSDRQRRSEARLNRFIEAAQSFLALPFTLRQRRLSKSRPPFSGKDFVAAITQRGGDASAAGWMWDHLKDSVYYKSFTPYPDDSLASVFGIAEEELEIDIITTLLERASISLPTTEILQEFGPVATPLQVALLVSHMRGLDPEAN